MEQKELQELREKVIKLDSEFQITIATLKGEMQTIRACLETISTSLKTMSEKTPTKDNLTIDLITHQTKCDEKLPDKIENILYAKFGKMIIGILVANIISIGGFIYFIFKR